MRVFKVLNNYAGIGGNRKLWPKKILINGLWHIVKVTAVELNPVIAKIYQDFFPDDEVIVGDAKEYLINHFREFGFIWSSPPCQTHSRIGYYLNQKSGRLPPQYIDMTLWQEILFLQTYCKQNWVIENVKPYYKALIQPDFIVGRHYFWSSKLIMDLNAPKEFNADNNRVHKHGFDIDGFKMPGISKQQVYRNCTSPEIGEYIFNRILEQ
jgi:DNA (cytosine-5)-methyltransferase 1